MTDPVWYLVTILAIANIVIIISGIRVIVAQKVYIEELETRNNESLAKGEATLEKLRKYNSNN